MTNTNEGFIITDITPAKRRVLALVTLKHRLRLEIETGLSTSSRGGLIAACEGWGYEGPKSKKKALAWVLEQLAEIAS